eukprot:1321054-Amorphochlora_amoeboformis.AAC.1
MISKSERKPQPAAHTGTRHRQAQPPDTASYSRNMPAEKKARGLTLAQKKSCRTGSEISLLAPRIHNGNT